MTESARFPTTIFLDVDGVVAPFPGASEYWGDWFDIKNRARLPLHVESGFSCHLSRKMGDALKNLKAEFVWLTTWEDLANELIAPYFGWEPLGVIRQSDVVYHTQLNYRPWWKLGAIENHVGRGGGPFIWADDDIDSETEITLRNCDVPHLRISPDTDVGLTPSNIEEMAEFIQRESRV